MMTQLFVVLAAALSITTSLLVLLVMQAMTHRAGFSEPDKLWMMVLRVGLGLLSIALFADGLTPMWREGRPWTTHVCVNGAICLVSIAILGIRRRCLNWIERARTPSRGVAAR